MMSNYLSRIVLRNTSNAAALIKPGIAAPAFTGFDPFQETRNEPIPYPNEQPNNGSPKQTNEPLNVIAPGTLVNDVHTVKQYITSHVERLNIIENKERATSIATKTESLGFIEDKGKQKPGADKNSAPNPIYPQTNIEFINANDRKNDGFTDQQLSSFNRTGDNRSEPGYREQIPINEQKKAVIKPSVKVEDLRNMNTPIDNSNTARLNPGKPHPVTINVKNNKTTPKLVIGKIIVEILPPNAPAPTKVINRVIQQSKPSEGARPNKFNFGLGQL